MGLYTILQIFSISLFKKKMSIQALNPEDYKKENTGLYKQLNLFES